MELLELIKEKHVLTDMRSSDHHGALHELVGHLGSLGLLEQDAALQAILEREEQVSTGIGSGVAIPHAIVPGIEAPAAIFGRSVDGIEFDAIDNAPVHLIILFVVPQAAYCSHLETLSAIAKMLGDGNTRARFIDAKDAPEILAILKQHYEK